MIVYCWVIYHSVPHQILSDQGREFEGQLFKLLDKLLEVKTLTSPYRQQMDGQVERFNRMLFNMLSAFVMDAGTDWDKHLLYVVMAYHMSTHTLTGYTPQVMVCGKEADLHMDLVYNKRPAAKS